MLVGADEHQPRAIIPTGPVRAAADGREREARLRRRRCDRRDRVLAGAECEQRETAAQPVMDADAVGERQRREMVARPRRESVLAARPADRARRAGDDRRALVMGHVGRHPRGARATVRRPGLGEPRRVARRIEAVEEQPVLRHPRGDKAPGGVFDHRPALGAVGAKQRLAAPPAQHRRELPGEIDRVLEAGVEAEPAIRRVAVGGVAGDQQAPAPIGGGDGDAHVPDAEMVEAAGEGEARRLVQQTPGVLRAGRRGCGPLRQGRVEEPVLGGVDPAEEAPIAGEVGTNHPVDLGGRKSL